MRSKWLETASSTENLHDDGSSDARGQPSTSGRQHGWFRVMQGIRRSLDVHLKSYNKIDSAFASTSRITSASDKLKALTRAVTNTGLVDFCCVYLVHPARGTFGIIALNGAGAELYPPCLADEEAQQAIRLCDAGSSSFLNVFNRCVFQVNDSNWCVEDVVASKAPWYYDCASAANGFGLPQDGGWLRRVGMRSMLALPCMQGEDVTGVLAVASKQKSLDHLLLRKLEELCFKITPTVTDAVVHYSPLLCDRRVTARYESVDDFAHEVLGELLNLDRAVAASVNTFNRTSGNMSQQQRQQQSQAAVAAAAAAGFSWTAPTVPSQANLTAQHERPSAQSLGGVDTFCTALTDAALYSVVLTSDLASASMTLHIEDPSSASMVMPERLTPPAVAAVMTLEFATAAVAAPQAAQPTHGSPTHGWSRAPHASTSRSLPERQPAAAAASVAAIEFLRGADTAARQARNHHHHLYQPQGGAASRAASGTDRRSSRSLSCLDLSGSTWDAREELARDSNSKAPPTTTIWAKAAARTPPASCDAPRTLRAPPQQLQPSSTRYGTLAGAHGSDSPCSSNRSSDSGAGDGHYMIETQCSVELTAALRDDGGGMLMSPSAWSSKNMECRVMHRGSPLEPSIGCGARPAPAPAAAPLLAAARGSSCATDCSMAVADTATTTAYTNASTRLSPAWCSGGVRDLADAPRVSPQGASGCGRWSRDSAAAAAAIWNNEAAEAVAAAMRFTAEQDDEDDEMLASRCGYGGESLESGCIGKARTATSASHRAAAAHGRGGFHGVNSGGLYGIRESGPVPSPPMSLEFSDSDDDGGVTVLDVSSSPVGGFVCLSSGLGEEALRRQRERRDSSCSRSSGSHSQSLLSQAAEAYAAAGAQQSSSYKKMDAMSVAMERRAVRV